MKSTSKWFLIPPAAAALLILGTLSMQGTSAAKAGSGRDAVAKPAAVAGEEAATPPERTTRTAPTAPRTPDLWQMSSGLVGVLLLGIGGLFVLRRLRGGAVATRGTTLMTLRQTLRLGARQALHAIEFDERILLVGETDKGLVLIESGKLPERTADEQEVLARATSGQHVDALAGDEDEGAVPKNLVIPRPETVARRLPKPPVDPAPKNPAPGLGDFRNLLQKVGRS